MMLRVRKTATAIFFIVQSFCILGFFIYYISPFPPDAYDQALYLEQVYRLAASDLGAIFASVASAGPQSALFIAEGAVMEKIFHIPRFSQLLINYGALVALEVMVFLAVGSITKAPILSMVAVGLLLTAHTLWFWAGGLFDFRIDWLASCFFGIWCCAVLKSNVFQDRKWSLIATATACFLILNRYITFIYIIGVELPLLFIIVAHQRLLGEKGRLKNIVMTIVVKIMTTTPFVVLNWRSIHGYYIEGHLTGSEKQIRAKEFGVTDALENILYYPKSILTDHLGPQFGYFTLSFFVLCLVTAMSLRATGRQWSINKSIVHTYVLEAVFLVGAVLSPIVVLTSDLSKSPVVGGIVDVPIVLLIVLIPRWIGLCSAAQESWPHLPISLTPRTLGVGFILAGLASQIFYSVTSLTNDLRTNAQFWDLNVRSVVLDMVQRKEKSATIISNNLTPHIIPAVFQVAAYELGHPKITFQWSYAIGIFAPPFEDYWSGLKNADYAFLSNTPRPPAYPVSEFFKAHDDEIRGWVRDNMDKVLELDYDGGSIQTFRKRPDLVQNWSSGSYGPERYSDRVFQWHKNEALLKVSLANFPCMIVPMFAAGPDKQIIYIRSNRGDSRELDITGTNVLHPVDVVLPLAPRDQDVTFAFTATGPSTRFPNDGREAAFGADQGRGSTCSDTKR